MFLFFLFFHYVFLYIDTYSRAFKWIGLELCTVNSYRDVTAGATAVAPKFSDALTLFQPGGQILPNIAKVAQKFPRGYINLVPFWSPKKLSLNVMVFCKIATKSRVVTK